MKIYIQDSKGKEVPVDDVYNSTKVKELKEKIKNITKMSGSPELAFGGYNLEDDETLEVYDIQEFVKVICFQQFPAGLNK